MKTVGIVAEYNPFHEGHKYHIAEAKRVSGADKAVVVMSGSFVQRGEPACADKFIRAGWAISGGADMVIELPEAFSLACAERFAGGAVRILAGLGFVDAICFGSESGDIEMLTGLAEGGFDEEAFAEAMSEGRSYASALGKATGTPPSPNDILGTEYIRAVKKYAPDMEIFTVKRVGGCYSESELSPEFSSARAIRNALANYNGYIKMSGAAFEELSKALPRDVLNDISRMMKDGSFPATAEELSSPILYKLRSMSAEETAALPETAEGLENLFKKHALSSSELYEFLENVKSKRYTMARLKRTAMCALLGIDKELQDAAAESYEALYARVLAVRKGSQELLSMLENASIPVIVQSSDREKLHPLAAAIEEKAALAHRVRALGQPYDKSVIEDMSHRLIVR
jgi:predicted nucleotidyltransferase